MKTVIAIEIETPSVQIRMNRTYSLRSTALLAITELLASPIFDYDENDIAEITAEAAPSEQPQASSPKLDVENTENTYTCPDCGTVGPVRKTGPKCTKCMGDKVRAAWARRNAKKDVPAPARPAAAPRATPIVVEVEELAAAPAPPAPRLRANPRDPFWRDPVLIAALQNGASYEKSRKNGGFTVVKTGPRQMTCKLTAIEERDEVVINVTYHDGAWVCDRYGYENEVYDLDHILAAAENAPKQKAA